MIIEDENIWLEKYIIPILVAFTISFVYFVITIVRKFFYKPFSVKIHENESYYLEYENNYYLLLFIEINLNNSDVEYHLKFETNPSYDLIDKIDHRSNFLRNNGATVFPLSQPLEVNPFGNKTFDLKSTSIKTGKLLFKLKTNNYDIKQLIIQYSGKKIKIKIRNENILKNIL